MTLAGQIRRYAPAMIAIVALAVAAAAVGAYILDQQRLRWPWEERYTIRAEFASAQAVMPGQGQTVAVAGVEVGRISGVRLREGRAVVDLEIDPGLLPAVHADARAWLRPKTGLQDMTVQLDPGSRAARRLEPGSVIRVERTRSQVDVHEVLRVLDADTGHYVRTLLGDFGRGLGDRGATLRRVLRAAAPTAARTRRVTAALTDRSRLLARLVSNLRVLGEAAATHDAELVRLVTSGHATVAALAAEDDALRATLDRLPGTLDATRGVLATAEPLAGALRPALRELTPAVRDLEPALDELDPLLLDARPALGALRGLSRSGPAVLADLTPALGDLERVTPDLTQTFGVLTRVVNELAFNPEGPEEGYLFWTAWFFHNAASILAVQDAHGTVWRGQIITSCSSLAGQVTAPLVPLLAMLPACPDPAPTEEGR